MKKAKFKSRKSSQKDTVETLLNELFSLDNQADSKTKMEAYADEIGVNISV